jgi:hypothetical protein
MMSKQPNVGTGVTPSILVPTLPGTFRASEITEQILDQGRRGIDSMDFRAVEGVSHTEITWDGLVQQGEVGATDAPAVIGYLIANLFGDGTPQAPEETDDSPASTRFAHTLRLGTTKEYLTIEHDAGGITGAYDRRFIGCRVQELTIQWNSGEGALTYSVTLTGQGATYVTAAVEGTATVPRDPWLGWQCLAKVPTASGTADNARVISGEWTFRRAPERFYGAVSPVAQQMTDLYLGPLEAIVSLVFDYSTHTDLTAFRNKGQAEVSTIFRTGTTDEDDEEAFKIGGIEFDLGDGPAELDNSSPNVRLTLTARGLYSTANTLTSSGQSFFHADVAVIAQNGPVMVQIVQPQNASNGY